MLGGGGRIGGSEEGGWKGERAALVGV